MNADGSGLRRLTRNPANDFDPTLSSDGSMVAFRSERDGNNEVYVMRADGSGERILTEGYHNEGPTWAPNGRVIMFFRDPGGNAGPALYTVDVTGRNEQMLKTPSYASDPAWSPLLQ